MPIKQVLLDMDGVLFDFIGRAFEIHGIKNFYDDPKNIGHYSTEQAICGSRNKFWDALEIPGFWENLELCPDAGTIVDIAVSLVGIENVAIATKPSESDFCIPGKKGCIRKHFPELAQRIIFTGCKEFCASPTRLLIDDTDHFVEAFAAAGGMAALVPRPWNKLHKLSNCAVVGLEAQIAKFK